MAIIEVQGLRKSYDGHTVLDGVDLSVERGETLGVLGPNGAGKTTLVEVIGGLREPDAGTVRVDGSDPAGASTALRSRIGMQLQSCRLPPRITPREALDLFATFYTDPVPTDELLDGFGLAGSDTKRFDTLSGGQQQRLSVALALIGRPRIAILDELTTGLDPAARRMIWDHLDRLRQEGSTMLLVTHAMEEAQRLCDRVIVLRSGGIVVDGRPGDLADEVGAQEVSFAAVGERVHEEIRNLPSVHAVRTEEGRDIVEGDASAAQDVLAALAGLGITPTGLRVRTPTLDDVYLRATADRDDDLED